jgi:HEAT repeat protein
MSRIGWLVAVVAFGWVVLLVAGCEEPGRLPTGSGGALAAGDVDLQTQAHQVIIDGLSDADPQVRANAVEVVATAGAIRLMPKVQKLLSDPSVPVRFAVALAIGDLEYALAKDDVARLLTDENPNIKIAAAYALLRLGRPEHYQDICTAVASNDQTVRANAALLLGKSGRQEGLRFLYWVLQRSDSADKVTLQAAESIAMLKDHRIYPKLWAQLISAYADDRVLGIQAMGALGSDEAKNALITMLDDTVPEVRLAAAEQLGKLGEPIGESNVLAILRRSTAADTDAQGQERLKRFAALAIGEIGTEPLTKYLPALLSDPSKAVRLAAAKAVLRSQRLQPASRAQPAPLVPSAVPAPVTPAPARTRPSGPVIIDLREPPP